ncbi:MAG: DUF5683 domain-containing protein [Bacteroidota bacterium]
MKKFISSVLLAIVLLSPWVHTIAQSNITYRKADTTFIKEDTTFVELPDSIREKEHSPTKATLMSAVLPGLGQFYNKKYWKIPILYAGFGALGYFIYFNSKEYSAYKSAYIESTQGNKTGKHSDLVNRYTADELLSARDFYRRDLEISYIFTAVWYALNILDATVDAHLYSFNITDRLTMKVEPSAPQLTGFTYKPSAGIKLSLHF